MNQGQNLFYQFIMDRVSSENKEGAQKLLEESFTRQANGTFTKDFLQEVQERLLNLIQPQYVEEVKNAMGHFASQLK